MNDLLLPERAVLVHIGPHKTGTTTIQGALHQARSAVTEHGVVYPGRQRQHILPARAVTQTKGVSGDPPATPEHWEQLVAEVDRARDQRVVVSSEFFEAANDQTIRRIVGELGVARVHILVTLRPLGKILPSAWQQHVRNRLRVGYDRWLDGVFNIPPYTWPTPSFWRRHHHDVLVQRWASIVGPQNLTVVMVDEFDRYALMRPFEQLLGLPADLLDIEQDYTNRSLTYPETELIRHLNIAFAKRRWSDDFYRDIMRAGVIRRLQTSRTPPRDEPRIVTPSWALERAAAIGAAAAERIASSGVRIVGDISALGTIAGQSGTGQSGTDQSGVAREAAQSEPVLPTAGIAEAVLGTTLAGVRREDDLVRAQQRQAPARPPRKRLVTNLTSAELVAIVARRGRRRVRRKLRGR